MTKQKPHEIPHNPIRLVNREIYPLRQAVLQHLGCAWVGLVERKLDFIQWVRHKQRYPSIAQIKEERLLSSQLIEALSVVWF